MGGLPALRQGPFRDTTSRAIHSVIPGLLVIYADWQSRRSRLYYALTRKPNLQNAMYSYEFYGGAWSSKIQNRFEHYHQRAVAWNLPGWVDEFDAFQYGRRSNSSLPGDPNWRRDTLAMLAKAQKERIGWSFVGVMDDALASALAQGH